MSKSIQPAPDSFLFPIVISVGNVINNEFFRVAWDLVAKEAALERASRFQQPLFSQSIHIFVYFQNFHYNLGIFKMVAKKILNK